MRVVKTIEREEFIGCPDCKALLAYTENDILEDMSGGWNTSRFNGDLEKYIYCPVCGERITITRCEVKYGFDIANK